MDVVLKNWIFVPRNDKPPKNKKASDFSEAFFSADNSLTTFLICKNLKITKIEKFTIKLMLNKLLSYKLN
ncbi:hypothetical protein D0809_02910 [Flavobacterium circumlabens]|uniref:Uncharacterized protein n=1 Tax=Flavobacterium circumlabens TaxID=2133765 RepID=A0A4Y7UHS4_9FLAO|nr:hypothetical protein EV142_101411 [Flavobacterium circumlabens]TEB45967.1 hypothetical protein D0809_02910 [Flavobacterium circumlabens]